MTTDRNFQLFLTRLSAADLACIAGLHQGSGDEAAERVRNDPLRYSLTPPADLSAEQRKAVEAERNRDLRSRKSPDSKVNYA